MGPGFKYLFSRGYAEASGMGFVYKQSAKSPLGAVHAIIVIPASYDGNLVASFAKMPISTRSWGFSPFFLGVE